MEYDVFISYGSQNRDAAEGLCAYLEEHGLRCWIAPRNIPSGSNYAGAITRALRSSENLIVICSKASSQSGHVKNEVTLAFNQNKHILPYCLDDEPFDDDLEYFLSSKQQIRSCGNLNKDYERIRGILSEKVSPDSSLESVEEPAIIEGKSRKTRLPVLLPAVLVCIALAVFLVIRYHRSPNPLPNATPPVSERMVDTFSGTIKDGHPDGFGTYTFAQRRRIDQHDSKERIAEPGDYIKGNWKNGHMNQGEWYSAKGEKKAYINLGDNPDVEADWELGTCEQCEEP